AVAGLGEVAGDQEVEVLAQGDAVWVGAGGHRQRRDAGAGGRIILGLRERGRDLGEGLPVRSQVGDLAGRAAYPVADPDLPLGVPAWARDLRTAHQGHVGGTVTERPDRVRR